jgi:thioredoxin 1
MKYLQTIEELETALEKSENIIVMFSATWCGPCKKITPDVEKLESEHLSVYKVDMDYFEDVSPFQITALPTFLFYKNGVILEKYAGSNIDAIRDRLNKQL